MTLSIRPRFGLCTCDINISLAWYDILCSWRSLIVRVSKICVGYKNTRVIQCVGFPRRQMGPPFISGKVESIIGWWNLPSYIFGSICLVLFSYSLWESSERLLAFSTIFFRNFFFLASSHQVYLKWVFFYTWCLITKSCFHYATFWSCSSHCILHNVGPASFV